MADDALAELAALENGEALCRRLLASPWGWGRSTCHREAVELLAGVTPSSELPAALVALLLCTCRRWDRVTGRLITALEQSGLLDAADLDELAQWLLAYEHVIVYPLTWASPEWLEIELEDDNGRIHQASEDTLAHHSPGVEPPLRRWAARHALAADPARLQPLLDGATPLAPRHRDAVIHGLLDAAHVLDEPQRRALGARGLKGGQSGVRLAALDLTCELDGPDAARRRARQDANATVRRWTPPIELRQPTLL